MLVEIFTHCGGLLHVHFTVQKRPFMTVVVWSCWSSCQRNDASEWNHDEDLLDCTRARLNEWQTDERSEPDWMKKKHKWMTENMSVGLNNETNTPEGCKIDKYAWMKGEDASGWTTGLPLDGRISTPGYWTRNVWFADDDERLDNRWFHLDDFYMTFTLDDRKNPL